MPNWCENELTVTGPVDRVGEFMSLITQVDQMNLDFNLFVPYPAEYKHLDQVAQLAHEAWRALPEAERPPYSTLPRDGYNSGGYEWCVRNWGTKWNVNHEVGEIKAPKSTDRRRSVRLTFNTAWSPPTPVVLAMSHQFPDIKFTLKYWEQGCGFRGTYRAHRGGCTEDTVDNQYRGRRGG